MRRLFPHPADDVTVETAYSDLAWAPRDGRPLVALNMVSSVDGRATFHGRATGLGSETDHALMMALRANADAIMHGAGTGRVDRLGKGVPDRWVPYRLERGLSPQPLLSFLTASGNLPLEKATSAESERLVVFVAERTPPDAVARLRERANVHVAGEDRPDPARAVAILGEEHGVRHVLCEGGPHLNHSLLTARVLDELFFTLAPKFVAGDGLTMVIGDLLDPPIHLQLRSLYEQDSELFLRYSVVY